MREISAKKISEAIKDLCIRANYIAGDDIYEALKNARENENSSTAEDILRQLMDNADIAKEKQIPICQDTGMAVVFAELGQEVHITDGSLTDAINEGVARGYTEGYLRKSVVSDPILRKNTNDNTPAVIHYSIVAGDSIRLTVAPKGFGSENTSRLYMLKPAQGIEGVRQAIISTVKEAGPNSCPPMVVGVGIGGDFEQCAYLAKRALLRKIGDHSSLPHIKQLECELLTEINNLGIGPQGLGGKTTALGINIEVFPTHIAGLPVAVNTSCHVTRHASAII